MTVKDTLQLFGIVKYNGNSGRLHPIDSMYNQTLNARELKNGKWQCDCHVINYPLTLY